MLYTDTYHAPIGLLTLASDGEKLTGIWFDGQKYFGSGLSKETEKKALPVFEQTVDWLDLYFSGQKPYFTPPLLLSGSDFRMAVWNRILQIPYGETVTYGQIAKELSVEMGFAHMSAQAVGGAVGHNPISIIVPCHRVLGAGGKLTGYAGGIKKKMALLELEGIPYCL